MKVPHDPKTFVREFFAAANAVPPAWTTRQDGNTRWFGARMHDVARRAGLHCQNKEASPSGEWMNIDHVFVRRDVYNEFPIVAVEHDNGDISSTTKRGAMPTGTTPGAHIEWALWKTLTMRAKLNVLVAYPWESDTVAMLSLAGKMFTAFRSEYGHAPPALLLFGWWKRDRIWTRAEDLYEAYVPDVDAAREHLAAIHLPVEAPAQA